MNYTLSSNSRLIQRLAHISDFLLKLDLLNLLKASKIQFTIIDETLLYEDSFLIFVEFGSHDAQPDCLYDVPFDFLFLNAQHLCGLGVAGLFDVFEESGDGLDSDFSLDLFFLQVELLPYCDFIQCRNITGHSALQQWIQFMGFD